MAVSRGVKLIQQELKRRGWKQSDLARRLGTDSGVVSRWMTGSRSPGIQFVLALQRVLNIPVEVWAKSGARPVNGSSAATT